VLSELPPGEQCIWPNGIDVRRNWKHVNQFHVELPDKSYYQKLSLDEAVALILAHTP
jgi:hypothetical protein